MQNKRASMRQNNSFEFKITKLSLSVSIPLLVLLLVTMISFDVSVYLTILTAFIGLLAIAITNTIIHQKTAYQFRSLSNLLDAMTKGDYALRMRQDKPDSALNELITSINKLAEHLSSQRLESVENQLLLDSVIDHVNVSILSIDESGKIHLLNPAARKLLNSSDKIELQTMEKQIEKLKTLPKNQSSVLTLEFVNESARYSVHNEYFRSAGLQYRLFLITDIDYLLRKEEDKAWQNLVRVLSHEINNSLTPIASISQMLLKSALDPNRIDNSREDLVKGLELIRNRSLDLREFVNSYNKLNTPPAPNFALTKLSKIADKLSTLFLDDNFVVNSDTEIFINCDSIQLEQVLINLIKNAIEASSQCNHSVDMTWSLSKDNCKIIIADKGTGISNIDNLFVPFFTTKPQGSGIGLIFSRQIVEAHNGSLTLNNRNDGPGCIALITLPLLS